MAIKTNTGGGGSAILAIRPGWTANIGMKLVGGTLTICGADGNDLTVVSPGFVAIHSTATPAINGFTGVKVLKIENNITVDDGNAIDSDFSGVGDQLFGTQSSVAWDQDKPFYLYAVNKDDTDIGLSFALAAVTGFSKTSSDTNDYGYKDQPSVSTHDGAFFFLQSTDPTPDYVSKPCAIIGGIRMRKDASAVWTIQNLDFGLGDGIRIDPFVHTWFKMVTGQKEAAFNSFFDVSGAALEPTWISPETIHYEYKVGLDGTCRVSFSTEAAGGINTNGDAGALFFFLPYDIQQTQLRYPIGYYQIGPSNRGILLLGAVNLSGAAINLLTSTADEISGDFFLDGDLSMNFQFTLLHGGIHL